MSSSLKVLVLNHLADRHFSAISSVYQGIQVVAAEPEEALSHIGDCDILVTWGWTDIRPLLKAAPKLQWVHALSAGVENLICPELQESKILLTNSRGIHGIPVSEHVFALMLAFSRGLNLLIRQQCKKEWSRVPTDEIHEKVLGIIGLGSIGREIAKKGKGLGMKVLATKRRNTDELFIDKMYPPEKTLEMLSLCDYVIVSLPLVDETKQYIRLEHFQAMKPSAYFINIARGSIVAEDALVTALRSGLIKGAGLDVFEHEPLPETSPLWEMDNVIITPHLAALSPCYLDRAIQLFADDLTRFCHGREMFNIIDKTKGY